jgi:hypothetical protein
MVCELKVKKIIELAKEIESNFKEVSKLYSPEYEKEFRKKITPKYRELQREMALFRENMEACQGTLARLTLEGFGVSDIDIEKFEREMENLKKVCE